MFAFNIHSHFSLQTTSSAKHMHSLEITYVYDVNSLSTSNNFVIKRAQPTALLNFFAAVAFYETNNLSLGKHA